MKFATEYHVPVMADTAVQYLLNPAFEKNIFADCTLGGGGYTELICKSVKDNFRILCIDKDFNAIEYAQTRLEDYKEHLTFINGNFASLHGILQKEKIDSLTGIVADLGLSSYQLTGEDGFSFMRNTPLDMRADKSSDLTAADILNDYSVDDLSDVLEKYGEINNSGRLAKAIAEHRKKNALSDTFDLIDLIKKEYGFRKEVPVKFLSKIFQSLRIEVNDELNDLKNLLDAAIELLTDGGRLVIVSYHSLEDRMVKEFLKNTIRNNRKFKVLTKKVIMPDYTEIKRNKKSRSAKLRCGELVTI